MTDNTESIVIENEGFMTPLTISHPEGVIKLGSWA